MRQWAALLLCALGFGILAGSFAYALQGTSATVGVPVTITTTSSGALPYMIGVIAKDNGGANAPEVEAWLGRDLDVIGSTADWTFTETNYPSRLRLTYAVYMTGLPNNTDMAVAASGGYDSHYQDMANAMASSGLTVYAIRPGWEMNGDWYPWSCQNADCSVGGDFGGAGAGINSTPQNYILTFRRIHDIFKAAMPNIKMDWNTAWAGRNNQTNGLGAPDYYPGDAYVDIVTMDVYERVSGEPTSWAEMLNGTGDPTAWDIQAMLSFAQAHSKTVGFPEWGSEFDDGPMMDSFITWFNSIGSTADFQTYSQYDPAIWISNAPNMKQVWIDRWSGTHFQP